MLANLVDIVYYSGMGFAVSSLNNAIIRTTDGGLSWALPSGTSVNYTWVSKPGASSSFLGNNMCLHPTDRNSIFIAFGNQVYKSRTKGEDWNAIGNAIPTGSTPHSFFVSPVDTNIWLVATESSPDKVYRTTDYGQTWAAVISLNFSNYGQPLEMDQNDPSVFYFTPDNGGFWKSTDNGATFSEISGNYPFRSPCDIIVMYDSSKIVFVADGVTGAGNAKIFKSVNGGVNWTFVHTVASSEVPSMCNSVFDKSTVWATEWSGSNIYKSTNFGDSWVTHHSNSFSGWGSDVCHEDPTLLVTGSWGAAATISVNSGDNWTNISSGLSGHGGGILIPDRGYIICHQGTNVYKLNILYSVITVPDTVASSSGINLNLKLIPEGIYYNLFNQLSRSDSLTVYLRNNTSPYSKIDSSKALIDSINFTGEFTFPNASSGTYYIATKHLNCIETWSKAGGTSMIINNVTFYDFTTAASQAYGNNLKLKGSKYCAYSGDINQDGIIDASDLIKVYNDSYVGLTGRYILSDLNGDSIVDASDISTADNNVYNGVMKITP
ncbi:MAG: hypothetical protein IPN57_13230 [Ignavibacteria bacterium]|nr:hypothetical protein [Ignavibacteria bacterium]